MRQIERELIRAIQAQQPYKNRNTRLDVYRHPDGRLLEMICRLHNHPIAIINETELILDTCGWETLTTRSRMNAVLIALDVQAQIYQMNFVWYLVRVGVREQMYFPFLINLGSDIYQYCETHGFTDPFRHEGQWWAFPANSVMAVPLGF